MNGISLVAGILFSSLSFADLPKGAYDGVSSFSIEQAPPYLPTMSECFLRLYMV